MTEAESRVAAIISAEERYVTDFGVMRPDAFVSNLLGAMREKGPKRRTAFYKAIDDVVHREMQARAQKAWEAGEVLEGTFVTSESAKRCLEASLTAYPVPNLKEREVSSE